MTDYVDFTKHVAEITHLFGAPPFLIEPHEYVGEAKLNTHAVWQIDPDDDNEMSLDMDQDDGLYLLILSLAYPCQDKLYAVLGYCALEGIRCRVLDHGMTIHPAQLDANQEQV